MWYVPVDKEWRWTFEVTPGVSLTPQGSDHSPVWLEVDNKTGEIGNDRTTIDIRLFDDPRIKNEIKKIKEEEFANNRKAESTKWKRTHKRIRDFLKRKPN